MQVSEQKDHITHAVIGGGKTIDFGISNSAEFFNILSSTLYKDQKLAVVREVLCNAWDAHIEAGCTDVPVEVTLTPTSFMIKDCGKGIHHDDMGLIYGTYGNSTKKNDGMQTGGFGLGCKAPFAYTDHFEVISSHDGIRTIYNLSKSSAQALGKPGIVPITSFPTKETGLQVSIPILNQTDYHRFKVLVKRIIKNGDMNMTVNGDAVEKINFDTEKANCLLTRDTTLLDSMTPIMIRYGNVIYPVDTSNDIGNQYAAIVDYLKKLEKTNSWSRIYEHGYHIIFQAPPHSISVTPSRESLSMQSHTINTLKGLFADFLKMMSTDFVKVCDEVAITTVDEAIKENRITSLLSTSDSLPLDTSIGFSLPAQISDLGTMARRYMEANYPASLDFRKKDIKYRLEQMVKAKQLNPGLVQTFLREMKGVNKPNNNFQYENTDWLKKRVVGKLMGKLLKAGLSVNDLYVFDPDDRNAPKSSRSFTEAYVGARSVSPKHLFQTLPYLRNIVVLATSIRTAHERAMKHEVFKRLGTMHGYLFYQVGLKKSDKEAALDFFTKTGMEVVDLTFKQEWEIVDAITRTPAEPRKKPKKGVPCLSAIKNNGILDTSLLTFDNVSRIENPEFIIQVSLRAGTCQEILGIWSQITSKYIVDLFGDKGAITNNTAIYTKQIEKGVRPFEEYVTEKISAYVMTSPTIKEYWAFNPNRVIDEYNLHYREPVELIQAIYKSPALCKMHGLNNNLTLEDQKYIALWQELASYRPHREKPDCFKKTKAYLDAIPLDPANKVLIDKLKDNKMIGLIDERFLVKVIGVGDPASPEVKKAIEIMAIIFDK